MNEEEFQLCVDAIEATHNFKNRSELWKTLAEMLPLEDIHPVSLAYLAKKFKTKIQTPKKKSKIWAIISTPPGECPVNLLGKDRLLIDFWINTLIWHGYKENKIYDGNAIKYFVREFYHIDSNDYNTVISYLRMKL